MIKVLIIDGSFFARKVLERILSVEGEIEVVGVASDGAEGLKKLSELRPDVVCLDIVMPREDGPDVLESIFCDHPAPVVVVSAVSTAFSGISKSLLQAGMLHIVHKPDSPENFPLIREQLLDTIRSAAGLKAEDISSAFKSVSRLPKTETARKIIVIGCPVSRPVQLEAFLASLPKPLSAGIVVRLFMYTQIMDHWVGRIKRSAMLSGKIAEDGDMIVPGKILFSPNEKAIEIRKLADGGMVRLLGPGRLTKDYIDTLFESAANTYRENTIAVLFAETATDGIDGLRAVKRCRGKSFVELSEHIPVKISDERLATAVLPLSEVSEEIAGLLKNS